MDNRIGSWVLGEVIRRDDQRVVRECRHAEDPMRSGLVTQVVGTIGRDESSGVRFRMELAAPAKLQHPMIARLLEHGLHDDLPYFIHERIAATTLADQLRRGRRFPVDELLRIGRAIATALNYAHRRGMMHGDLSPADIVIGVGGAVQVLNIGIAKLFAGTPPVFDADPLCPAAFMSPERAAGKALSKKSDFYSLGCILYAVATGRPPFSAANLMEMSHRHSFVLPDRPAHFARDLSTDVDALIMKLLAKDPVARPGSGTMLVQEIEGMLGGLGIPVSAGAPGAGDSPEKVVPVDSGRSVEHSDQGREDVPAVRSSRSSAVVTPAAPKPLMSRGIVIIPLFLLVVGILVIGFLRSRRGAEELYRAAEPLIASENPDDWERAWNDYLEPLSRKFPDQYRDEVRSMRERVEPIIAIRRSVAMGSNLRPQGEAMRFFQIGLRLAQAGDLNGARATWRRVTQVFDKVEAEQAGVTAAHVALDRTADAESRAVRDDRIVVVRSAIDRAAQLRRDGKAVEAEAMLSALEELYRDDPANITIRDLIKRARGS